jgi:hypothetical protein
MPASDELARLIAARPPILAQTESVVDNAEAERIFQQILSSGPPASQAHPVSRPRRFPGARRSFRVAIGAVVTAAAAATVLVGLNAFTGAGPATRQAGRPAGQHPVVINARTLADKVSTALTAASHKAVLYTRTSCACGTTAVTREWDYGISTREEWFGSRGPLTFDPHAIRALIASYPWPPQFGSMTTITLNGRRVVKITRKFVNRSPGYPLPLRTIGGFAEDEFPVSMPAATPSATSLTVWFDAATYLPVQEAQTASSGQNIEVSTYAWLPPTPANLAKVRTPAPVPAGFTHTQLPGH